MEREEGGHFHLAPRLSLPKESIIDSPSGGRRILNDETGLMMSFRARKSIPAFLGARPRAYFRENPRHRLTTCRTRAGGYGEGR